MITLHGLTLSNYYNKVKIVLLEKGVPFTEKPQRVRSSDEAVLRATPLGKIPFIEIDGQTLCESQVIVDFLEARFPQPPLLPADALAAAKVRELTAFMELYLELVARRLYVEAFFGGSVSQQTKDEVREQLDRHVPAFRRLARFAPYLAGETFTLADAAGYAALPAVAMATQNALGEDMLARHGVEWKAYVRSLGERASIQRVAADRQRDRDAAAAAAAATAASTPR